MLANAANASSFVVMGEAAPASTPSIVSFSDPAPGRIMPSVIAMGEPAPAVTYEKVAAIPNKKLHGPRFKPLVIRGGIVGDAFAPAEPKTFAAAPKGVEQARASASPNDSPAAPDKPAYLPPNGFDN